MGRIGTPIVNELRDTERPHVIVDMDGKKAEEMMQSALGQIFIKGDATELTACRSFKPTI
jgi:Trk K+ transport system NAD-binding subunit